MKKKEAIIVSGIEVWQCSKCRRLKVKTSFYKDKRTSNGLTAQCKICHTSGSMRTRDKINTRRLNRESMRRVRQANPEKFRQRDREAARKRPKNTPARKAYDQLHNALGRGIIHKPLRCEECSRKHRLTAHHEDYNKPLQVMWLCYECHGERHWVF